MVPSAQLALVSKVTDPRERIHDVEAVEEKGQKAVDQWFDLSKRISRAYNIQVKFPPLKVGDLVLKAVGHIQKGANASKFALK